MEAELGQDGQRLRAALALVLTRYGRQLRVRPWLTAAAFVLPGFGSVFVFYVPPLAIARLLEALSRATRPSNQELGGLVGIVGAAWLFGEVLWRVGGIAIARLECRGLAALYVEAMDELARKDVGFYQESFAGSLTKKALGYARRFEDVIDVLAFSVVANVLPIVFAIVVLACLSPWLVVVLVVMLTIAFVVARPLIVRRQSLVQIREEASNVLAGHVADTITNAEAVRDFAREAEEAGTHAKNVRDYTEKMLRSWDFQNLRIDIFTSPLYVATNTLGLATALVLGRTHGIGPREVFLTFSYFATATRVVWEFNHVYRNLESALTDAAQFTELLLDPPAITDAENAEAFAPRDTSVRFRAIRFAHGTRPPLFDGFDLAIAAGEKVGLVGRSGAGKTTLARLLVRFADIAAGSIEIGGQDIARVKQAALRSFIARVPQDPSMFHRSILENIRFGRPEATDEEVRRAAHLAHAAEFIDALPDGYATLVGERGVKLSGGQRQRLAVARAILKDAPVLVLDEATSALDSESERHIQGALATLLEGRTAIVIAHRLSTVRRMDRLVVLDSGRIVEQGTHDELLARGGTYATLWAHQTGGFLGG